MWGCACWPPGCCGWWRSCLERAGVPLSGQEAIFRALGVAPPPRAERLVTNSGKAPS